MYSFLSHITVKQSLGALFGLFSEISLLLNIITLLSVFRLAFLSRKNQVYIIAFFNSLCDVLHMLLNVFYLAPSIFFSSFLVSYTKKNEYTLLLGSAFMFLWYFETATRVIMAINRFVVICLQNHTTFTFTSTTVLFLILIPICFATMFVSQYVNPCCSFLFDHEYFSYSYFTIEGVPNYSNMFDLPLNITTSVVSALCYLSIFWTVHKTTPTCKLSMNAHKARLKRDIRYAIQFSVLFVFHTLGYILLRVLPCVFNDQQKEWRILVPFFFLLDCSANAVIYLGLNLEVQNNAFPAALRSIFEAFGLKKDPKEQPQSVAMRVNETTQSSDRARSITALVIPRRRIQPFRSIGLRRTSRMV